MNCERWITIAFPIRVTQVHFRGAQTAKTTLVTPAMSKSLYGAAKGFSGVCVDPEDVTPMRAMRCKIIHHHFARGVDDNFNPYALTGNAAAIDGR